MITNLSSTRGGWRAALLAGTLLVLLALAASTQVRGARPPAFAGEDTGGTFAAADRGSGAPWPAPAQPSTLDAVSIGAQSGRLTYGKEGDANYLIGFIRRGTGVLSVTLNITAGLPTGTSYSFSPNPVDISSTAQLRITTSDATPAGAFIFTVQAIADTTRSNTGQLTIARPSLLVQVQTPASGATGVALMPAFNWSPLSGAVAYEWQIAKDGGFVIPLWGYTGDRAMISNNYVSERELEYGTTYFWRVRPVFVKATARDPGDYGEWTTGVFTTMAPPPTLTPTSPPTPTTIVPTTIVPPPVVPTSLIWAVIGLGVALFIALVILVVKTRR